MTRTLMKIQDEDADRMASSGDLPNYSKAGTGKTLSTLEAFKRAGHKRGLVLAPQIALTMWEQEIKDWLGASVQVVRGSSPIKGNPDFVVTTFDLAGGAMRSVLYKYFNEGALILDEAHNLRRHTSKRTMAVMGNKCDGYGGLIEKFDQVWSLTGNPILRHHDDLWSQIAPLFPWVFEKYNSLDYNAFLRNFCRVKVKKYHERMRPTLAVIGSQNEPIIHHMLYKEIGAIRRMEAPGLPELVEQQLYPKMGVIPFEYGKRVKSMSETDLIKALVSADDDDYSMQQVWQTVALAKVKGATDYIVECCREAPVLIGVWHNSVGQAYEDALLEAGLKAERVYGGTSAYEREAIRDRFNAGHIDVIVGQMQAMGVSWNLQTASNRVIIAQDHFSPGVIEQFYKRVYRTGQKRTTYLDFLTSRHSLDKAIAKMRKDRQRLQEKALDI